MFYFTTMMALSQSDSSPWSYVLIDAFFFFMGAFSFLPESKESGVRDEESAGGAAAAYIHREDTRALSY